MDRGGHLWPKDREVITHDGVHVRYTVRGPEDAPWVVLCAGYLCPDNFWWFLAPALEAHYRVVMLNYRGVGASTDPRPPGRFGRNLRAKDYAIEKLAGDVIAVVEDEGIDRASYVGHSMGCQVAVDVYRQLGASRVDKLILVTGPFQSPLETFYDTDIGTRIFPIFYRLGKITPEPLWRLIPHLARLPGVLELAQLTRAIGPRTPRVPMQVYVEHFRRIDAGVGLRLAQAMHRYDGEEILSQIERPTLVIVGEQDTFSPPKLADVFEELIPDCQVLLLPDATHAALLELPTEVNGAILRFLERDDSDATHASTASDGA